MKEKKVIVEKPQTNYWFFMTCLFIVLVMGLVIGIYQFQKHNSDLKKQVEQERSNSVINTNEDIVARVAKLIILPEDEPKVAIITEVDKIKAQQPIFNNAENGDYTLVFKDQVIIYSAKKNIIVATSPINIIEEEESLTTWNIEIRNGSKVRGAASKLAETLRSNETLIIGDVTNASNSDYQGNILVNFTDSDVTEIAQQLQASSTVDLPNTEASSTADLLLIIGN